MIIRGSHNSGSNGSQPPEFDPATMYLAALSVNVSGGDVATAGLDKIVELGESINVTLSGSITPNDETSISNRRIEVDEGVESDIPFSTNSFSVSDTGVTASRKYQGKADVDNNGNPTTINSVMRELLFYYPVLYGNLDNINLSAEDLYTNLTVQMAVPNQAITLTFPASTAGQHKVIMIPDISTGSQAWNAISSIIKDSQFEQIGSFVTAAKDVTKTGSWTQSYTMYATNAMNAMSESDYALTFAS